MKNTILGWLASHGVALANDAGDAAVMQAVQKVLTDGSVAALANAKEETGGVITALENERTTLMASVTALTNERDALKTKAAVLGNSRATLAVDFAITKGKLKPADREARITALANAADFDKESKALLDAASIVKLHPGSDAGKALANDMDADSTRSTYIGAVEKHMKDTGETDPIKAHKAVLKALPALAEALKTRKPGAA